MIPLPIQPHLLESMTSRTSSSRRSVGIPGGWCPCTDEQVVQPIRFGVACS